MKVCAFVFLSNHYHLLLRPRDASQLAAFMSHFNGNLAKEAGRLHRWRQKFWGRRYRAIPISFEPEAQIDRLKYLLEQGCKENLVAKPQDWPGASSLAPCAPASPWSVSGTTERASIEPTDAEMRSPQTSSPTTRSWSSHPSPAGRISTSRRFSSRSRRS